MSLAAEIIPCAQTVEKGDPDRFRTVMAAPVAARAVLFPLYALNVEVSRAPWVTQEAMIAEMRLQWWRDALEEIAGAREVRKHEVTTPLAGILSAAQAQRLDESVAARRWDIYKDAFEDVAHMDAYIDQTAGHLMWTACALLGAEPPDEVAVRDLAYGAGTAAFLRAVPGLAAAGRIPLLDGTDAGVVALAQRARDRLARPNVGKAAQPALWPAIGAAKTLDQVIRDPGAVAEARLDPGITPFRLARTALTGRLAL
ncbi:squalene/phytoene synthase family protein [uncultured Tateyamaria sp.]|uniref:squalene/phytoene synthase family protein n=1 Tax=uncultured Tateyamaria sp. TaxID=455651 RepID=UPI00262235FA|nr:squalene/phytoene synthase family protein [uncultured Tateyamaria sp.]